MMQKRIDKIRLVYYSGTGGTKIVADNFAKQLSEQGVQVTVQRLKTGEPEVQGDFDLLLVVYAVYALNAPEPVYTWIKNLPAQQGKSAVVISVSGGGEMSPNTACRRKAIKRLEAKGYHVWYEQMLVMPSNIAIATKPPLDKLLLAVLPHKIDLIVDEMNRGVVRRTKPHLFDRALAAMGGIEQIGAHQFGKRIRVSDACNGCGLCADSCPSDNITMVDKRPCFGSSCYFCMNCLYCCPQKALRPGIGKFAMIKTGFDLESLAALPTTEIISAKQLKTLAPGLAWIAVRKYINED
jgi:flavodoxin